MLELLTRLGLPANLSAQGGTIDDALVWTHILMVILFLFWAPFFIYTLIRFRKSKNPNASYKGIRSHFSNYMEGGVAVFEVVLLLGFAFPAWELRVNEVPPAADAEIVRVVAQQFKWNVHYPGPDGEFGRTDVSLINDEVLNFIGLDYESETAKDDILPPQGHLHLPVDKPAIIQLSTRDVIHSFSIPVMRVKQDVIPGMRIPVWFEPTQTGSWEIACAQLCGNSHYEMKGYIHIHTQKGYDAFMDALSIVNEIDDYDLTFEADKKLNKVIKFLRAGDAETAESFAVEAKSLAKIALQEKEEMGEEDEWEDWDEWE